MAKKSDSTNKTNGDSSKSEKKATSVVAPDKNTKDVKTNAAENKKAKALSKFKESIGDKIKNAKDLVKLIPLFFSFIKKVLTFPISIFKVLSFFLKSDFYTKSLMIIITGLIVLCCFGFFELYKMYYPYIGNWLKEDATVSEKKKEESTGNMVANSFSKTISHFKTLKEVVFFSKYEIELKDRDNANDRPMFAQFEIFVECSNQEGATMIKENEAKIKDYLTPRIPKYTYEYILTKEGKEDLRNKIITEMNNFLPKGNKVKTVFFSSFIVQ